METDLEPTTAEERGEWAKDHRPWRFQTEVMRCGVDDEAWPCPTARALADLERANKQAKAWIETSEGWRQRAEQAERERDEARAALRIAHSVYHRWNADGNPEDLDDADVLVSIGEGIARALKEDR